MERETPSHFVVRFVSDPFYRLYSPEKKGLKYDIDARIGLPFAYQRNPNLESGY